MSVTRINEFQAQPTKTQELKDFLQRVIGIVSKLDGCEACELLESTTDPARFVILETWTSAEVHQAAAKAIPKDMMATFMTLVAGPPKGKYFTAVNE